MSGRPIRSILHDRRGSVTVLAAVLLPLMIGVAALVLEFGGGLLTKVRLQRVADIAAFAGATAYSRVNTDASISSAAKMVGQLNGVAASAVTGQLAASPKGDGTQVVKVTVAVTNSLLLAKVIGFTPNLPVAATAYAAVGGGTSACVIALSTSGAGVTLSGGTSLSAPTCGVSSNVSIAVPCGTTVTAKDASYAGSAPSAPCSGLKTPSGGVLAAKQKTATDPLASEAVVATATGRLATARAISAPAAPTVTAGKDIDFAWNQSGTTSQAVAIGCTATWVQPTWTMTCPVSASAYLFGKLTVGGGIALKFNTSGNASAKYNFSEKLALSGSTLDFGPGVYSFAKGLSVGGGTTVTFGAGTFNFGRTPDTCGDGGSYSICHTGTALSFGGPSTFAINSGLYVGGGSVLTFGSGTTNSYDLGPASNGHAMTVAGGATVTFADASSGSGMFRASGNINLDGGGSCTTLPAAAQHDVKGFFASSSGIVLGAGVYTVSGHISFGGSSGGSTTCNGQSVGVKGTDVTLVMGGDTTYPSGNCQGRAFCVGSGFNNVVITAPSSGSTAKLVVVGPTSVSNAGAMFMGGAATAFSGAFYFPRGPIKMDGGASLNAGSTGSCLQIIGSEVVLSGGTTGASNCIGGATSSGTVALIQ
ncbi:TadE/TadG family type IV pilus assembly protein [Methylopila sp. M107]|uniref:TadE/TadG family type IV pilus assembly protein n=1 Tax=Methylopila sp. M107 TaxID=1101190 RepID=UPI00039F982F|nr:TadE/TadG family type IV pilus assembly protein [Methylopila sp. M107]